MPAPAETTKLPAVFGRYVLLHRLSRGGMGEIFLAKLGEIQGFEKPIVIKKILPHLANDKEFLGRFIEEAQIAIKLTHGNIVPVYEVGMVNEEYFIALQYIEGRDLRAVLTRCREQSQRISPDLCLFMVREIANGLAYAHRRTDPAGQPINLVHCDISPPNILITYEGEVKIIDFGIARSAIQRASESEEVGFGKFGYMAPEQLLRGAKVDRRADIYSTGVLLYELLTGERAFTFPPEVEYRHVARVVTAGKIAPPSVREPSLSDQLDHLVMRALKTEPAERHQSAEDLRDEIQQHLYAMNPTISADDLAGFMHRTFPQEIELDRSVLHSLSQTDVEPFRTELIDGSSHTVSYALAAPLSSRNGDGPRRSPAMSMAEARASQLPAPTGPALATRRIDDEERRRALLFGGADRQTGGSFRTLGRLAHTTLLALHGRKWIFPALALLAILSIGTVTALILARHLAGSSDALPDNRTEGDAKVDRLPTADAVEESHRSVQRSVVVPPSPHSGDAPSLDAGTRPVGSDSSPQIFFPPRHVRHPTRSSVPRRATHRRRTHKTRPVAAAKNNRAAKPKAPPKISPEMVQKKFKQVRLEYQRFSSAYGQLLEKEWQEIMFANTYGKMEESKYIRLNQMLDNLRQRMQQEKEGK